MTVPEKLAEQMKLALKSGQKDRLSALRMLKAELEVAQRSGKPFNEVDVVKAYAKKLHKVAEEYQRLGVAHQVEATRADLRVVEEFLPPQISRPELEQLIEDLIKESSYGPHDVGRLMKAIMTRYGDVVDGQLASKIAAEKLSQRQ